MSNNATTTKGKSPNFHLFYILFKRKEMYIHILGKGSSLYKHSNLTSVHCEPFETRIKTYRLEKSSNQTVKITKIKHYSNKETRSLYLILVVHRYVKSYEYRMLYMYVHIIILRLDYKNVLLGTVWLIVPRINTSKSS